MMHVSASSWVDSCADAFMIGRLGCYLLLVCYRELIKAHLKQLLTGQECGSVL